MATKAQMAAEMAQLRAEVSRLKVLAEMQQAAPKAEAAKPAPKSRVVRVKERVYATAGEAKAAFDRIVEWAKTHEAKVSLSGCKVYVKTSV